MAIVRCEDCGRPHGLKYGYTHFHPVATLVGSESVSRKIFCGSQSCGHRALILWLTDEEEKTYLCVQRSFRLSNCVAHVQVT